MKAITPLVITIETILTKVGNHEAVPGLVLKYKVKNN